MLHIQDLSFTYPHRYNPAVNDVTMTVEPGGVYGLLGANGVGKSTLLYLIAGLLTPQTGTVTMDGVSTRLRLPETLRDIFIVPEEFELPRITLKRYVELNSPFYPKFSLKTMHDSLDAFGMPHDINLSQLSMGQKKKAFMAFAIAANTPLLLMDEPTNGLDIPGKAAFRRFIAANLTPDRAVIISTHQVQDINLLLDHVTIMDNNGIIINQSVANLLAHLEFGVTNDPDILTSALYALPSLAGTCYIRENGTGAETELNLETLFDFATKKRSEIVNIFKS